MMGDTGWYGWYGGVVVGGATVAIVIAKTGRPYQGWSDGLGVFLSVLISVVIVEAVSYGLGRLARKR